MHDAGWYRKRATARRSKEAIRHTLQTHLQIVEVHGIVDGFPSDLSKDGVLAVQVVASIQRYKELAAVGVWCASICACHETPVVYICASPFRT